MTWLQLQVQKGVFWGNPSPRSPAWSWRLVVVEVSCGSPRKSDLDRLEREREGLEWLRGCTESNSCSIYNALRLQLLYWIGFLCTVWACGQNNNFQCNRVAEYGAESGPWRTISCRLSGTIKCSRLQGWGGFRHCYEKHIIIVIQNKINLHCWQTRTF